MWEKYLKRKKEFDWFIENLAKGKACTGGLKGFEHYDALYRVACLNEALDVVDADPGPYYPFVLLAHYFWRRSGDVYRACALLEKARGRRPYRRHRDEEVAAELLKAAIREGADGVRRVETEDGWWSWASVFKDLLIAELDPRERPAALQRIEKALELVFEMESLPQHIVEGYNIFNPYQSAAPYIYISYAAEELEQQEPPPRRGIRETLRRVIGLTKN
jgi:hypothetical protein